MYDPLYKRQSNQDAKREFIRGVILIVCQFILFCVSIAAIFIASAYEKDKDSSPCNDGTKYTVGLQTFLYVGAGTHFIYYGIWHSVLADFSGHNNKGAIHWLSLGIVHIILLAWAVIGLVMNSDQLSKECQDEAIGRMIVAWSVVPFCLLFSSTENF
eukprot:407163_1